MSSDPQLATPGRPRTRPGVVTGLFTGLITAAVALGVGQLVAGLTGSVGSPVVAVGGASIDLSPPPVKDFAISTFGSNDKTALVTGILVLLAVFAAVIGIAAVRRFRYGVVGLIAFTAVGLVAALSRPTAGPADVLPSLVGGAAGLFAMWRLVQAAHEDAGDLPVPVGADGAPGEVAGPVEHLRSGRAGGPGRVLGAAAARGARRPAARRRAPGIHRRVPVRAAAVPGRQLGGGGGGRGERPGRPRAGGAQQRVEGPGDDQAAGPVKRAPPLPEGTDLHIGGLSPFVTPNNSFYRVDTALVLPQVAPSSWQLRIHGMVAHEVTLTFDDLLKLPLIEDWITLCCVSNPVGGPYIGNALWLGTSLSKLLRAAGIRAGAEQLLCTSVDGFTSGTPVQTVMDGRDAMLAVAMNGTPLPVAHGFPARLVVPGLYGYVSACKWVTDIKVTTFAGEYAYWTTRGWSQRGADQDRVADRRAERLRHGARGPHGRRGRRLGTAQGHRGGRGAGGRRRLAPGQAGRGAGHRHLAAVGVGVGRDPRQPRHRGPRHG